MKYTKLEKQLIMLSVMGISITIEDGHRWIRCNYDVEGWEDVQELIENSINCKVYGGIKEAIIKIDKTLVENKYLSLEEKFNTTIDKKYDIEHKED